MVPPESEADMKRWEYYKKSKDTMLELAVQTVNYAGDWFYVVNGQLFRTRSQAIVYAEKWLEEDKPSTTTSGSIGILGACD